MIDTTTDLNPDLLALFEEPERPTVAELAARALAAHTEAEEYNALLCKCSEGASPGEWRQCKDGLGCVLKERPPAPRPASQAFRTFVDPTHILRLLNRLDAQVIENRKLRKFALFAGALEEALRDYAESGRLVIHAPKDEAAAIRALMGNFNIALADIGHIIMDEERRAQGEERAARIVIAR